jgi:hypothetical protein
LILHHKNKKAKILVVKKIYCGEKYYIHIYIVFLSIVVKNTIYNIYIYTYQGGRPDQRVRVQTRKARSGRRARVGGLWQIKGAARVLRGR